MMDEKKEKIDREIFKDKVVLGLFGAGGFAKEVMPIARECLLTTKIPNLHLCFVDTAPHQRKLNGYPVLSEVEFFSLESSQKLFNVAIGDSKLREKIAIKCLNNDIKPHTLRAINSVVYENNKIGEGAIICSYSTITSNAEIGSFFHANLYSYVAHDCVIGDYVTFAPNVHCNGHIHIHNHAYIGTGAIIKPGTIDKPLVIGEGAVIGMGAVVTKDVAPYTTVVGNPARPLEKPVGFTN